MVAGDSDRVVVGCAGLPQGLRRERFFEHVALLETDALSRASVKPKTLRKWREDAPNGAFSLVAPPPLGALSRDRTDAVEKLARAVEALAPQVVLLRTPADISPSAHHRAELAALAGELPAGDHAIAWEPLGLWTVDAARAVADALGWMVAFDPLAPEVEGQETRTPDADQVYFRLTGIGSGRRRFSDDDLYAVADRVRDAERAWVVFANLDKHRDARRLRALLDE